MKIELNLNEVSYHVIDALVKDNIIKLSSLSVVQQSIYLTQNNQWIREIIQRDDLSVNDKAAIVNNLLSSAGTVGIFGCEKEFNFVKSYAGAEELQKYKSLVLGRIFEATTKEKFVEMFNKISEFEIDLNSTNKENIRTNFWKYVDRCNTYATETSIYPENTPAWVVQNNDNSYDGIQRRIALHKATGWKHYDPNNPDSRVQVRAAYADFAGTKKGQAIHDNAYSLRKRAVKEHNLKLVSKKG